MFLLKERIDYPMNKILRLPRERLIEFDYNEKLVVEDILNNLEEQKIVLNERAKVGDSIFSSLEILDENLNTEDFKYYIKKDEKFYNLGLAKELYDDKMVEEIIYYVVQKFLRFLVDYIGSNNYKTILRLGDFTVDPELKIDLNTLKKLNFLETEEECRLYLDQFVRGVRGGEKGTRALNISDVKSENGLGYEDGDSDNYYYFTHEERLRIAHYIVKEWFVDRIWWSSFFYSQ